MADRKCVTSNAVNGLKPFTSITNVSKIDKNYKLALVLNVCKGMNTFPAASRSMRLANDLTVSYRWKMGFLEVSVTTGWPVRLLRTQLRITADFSLQH